MQMWRDNLRRRRDHFARLAGTIVLILSLAACGKGGRSPLTGGQGAAAIPVAQSPLKLDLSRAEREKLLAAYFEKPVMGRRSSMRDLARIADEVAPILRESVQQPSAAEPIRRIAADLKISEEDARSHWVALQEADVLLESGGDPEDVSSANAVGVAQWIAETGKRAGLKIDVPVSHRLTRLIDPLKRQAAWLEYLSKPDSDLSAPGNPGLSREQAAAQLPVVGAQLEMLRTQRRIIDERYDPRKALFAHARYLLGLYAKFPDLEWVFQAFHGGEAGVARTLSRYMGPKWKGNPASAIRAGNAGRPLSYEDVYFSIGPRSHAAAFAYIYGRGDDHRHYWWKLRAAREAIALYRKDKTAFQRRWESLLPGRAKEAMWYPNGPDAAFTGSDVESALRTGVLVPIKEDKQTSLLPRAARPDEYPIPTALRPESAGLLKLIVDTYRRKGGKARITVGDTLILRQAGRPSSSPAAPALWPPAPAKSALPGGGPPGDFDFHKTGWAFDLIRPADDLQRKTLEYALGYLRDRGVLWLMEETERGPRRYHIIPNPKFRDALTKIAMSTPGPPILGE